MMQATPSPGATASPTPLAGKEVGLQQMLEARESRAYRQQELLALYGKPLICFTMNIAGPVKDNDLIKQAFLMGFSDLKLELIRFGIVPLFEQANTSETGNEGYLVVDMDPFTLKNLTCELEDAEVIGRLYDIDVLFQERDEKGTASTRKLDREQIGLPGRHCLICDAPAKVCSSRRVHSVAELQERTGAILSQTLLARAVNTIAECACRALLYEVSITPKPGLVDRNNSGSHRDMDFYSFLDSSAALWPYFKECAELGQKMYQADAGETFKALRPLGKQAELRMFSATGGVNTHKGAIFSVGIVAAAAGRLSANLQSTNILFSYAPEAILEECKNMTKGLVERDFFHVTKDNAWTVGQQLYAEHGITGARGQMEAGLPVVLEHGLPLLRKLLAAGKTKDEAGSATLLTLIRNNTDTNLIHRSNLAIHQEKAKEAANLLESTKEGCPDHGVLRELDRQYIEKNLSPGGSADLLAICWLLHFLENKKSN